jgi:hypothetical protein
VWSAASEEEITGGVEEGTVGTIFLGWKESMACAGDAGAMEDHLIWGGENKEV